MSFAPPDLYSAQLLLVGHQFARVEHRVHRVVTFLLTGGDWLPGHTARAAPAVHHRAALHKCWLLLRGAACANRPATKDRATSRSLRTENGTNRHSSKRSSCCSSRRDGCRPSRWLR